MGRGRLGFTVAIGAMLLVGSAQAATVSVRMSEAGYASLTTSTTEETLVLNSAYGSFTTDIEAVALSQSPLLLDLGSTNFSSVRAGALEVEVTASELVLPVAMGTFALQLSGYQIDGAPGSVSVAAYLDANDTPFGMTTKIGSSGIVALPAFYSTSKSVRAGSPFSVTEVITIDSRGASAFSLDGSISAAVPEISTWAMMFAGFASLGLTAFRSRRTASPATLG